MTLKDLITLIQRSRVKNESLSQSVISKLTVDEQDEIIIGEITQMTLEEASSMIVSSSVTAGVFYQINGVNANLYGGTSIITCGLSNNSFSSNGWGQFYNPPYATIPVYNPNGSYSIGQQVIYGGFIWVNTTGNIGSIIDNFNLDTGDWLLDPFNETDYNIVWDEITYDWANDYITSRYEAISNITKHSIFFVLYYKT